LIQRPVCLDSIIARSQCSEEFCNTFGGKADMAIASRKVQRAFFACALLMNWRTT
jgi:hypothetical protein